MTAVGASRMEWLREPCVFLHKTHTNGKNECEVCQEPFSFWQSRSNCQFCGCAVHSKCSTNITRTNSNSVRNGRLKMCFSCCRYREQFSPLLRMGDEFINYNNEIPAASYLYLSESKQSLIITTDPNDVIETIPLSDILYIQKGFTHAGHINAGSQYNPIGCFSIIVSDQREYNLKCPSNIHCQLWINGLNMAIFLYKRVLEQEKALQTFKSNGGDISRLSKTANKYLSDINTLQQSVSSDDSLVIINNEVNPQTDTIVINMCNSRGSTPDYNHAPRRRSYSDVDQTSTSPGNLFVRKTHYKIRTTASPYKRPQSDRLSVCSNDWRLTDSSHSSILPYKGGQNNPLANYCICHAYAIQPPSAMLYSTNHKYTEEEDSSNDDPYKSCCHVCRDKCKLLKDLSLF